MTVEADKWRYIRRINLPVWKREFNDFLNERWDYGGDFNSVLLDTMKLMAEGDAVLEVEKYKFDNMQYSIGG